MGSNQQRDRKKYTDNYTAEKRESWEDKEKRYKNELARYFVEDFATYILSEKSDANEYITKIKHYTETLLKSVTTSQLRNIFSQVKRLDKSDKSEKFRELYFLRPKIAYTAGRVDGGKKEGEDHFSEFAFLLDSTIQKIDTDAKLKEFISFFEAIIAYHKYFGGNN